jgi:RNA-directed DNA polymerase
MGSGRARTYGGEGVTHSPIVPRCLLTARCGRFMCDLRRPVGVPAVYRKGRKPSDALGKIWREVGGGNEWIVDADLRDYFGSVDHEKLKTLIGKQIADGRVLNLVRQIPEAGYEERGRRYETPQGTPQGGVVSPLLRNILLTPFDKEMRRKGYLLTRWADDWVVTCRTRVEAEQALARATKILDQLGVTLKRDKTRIVHVANGFEFLGIQDPAGQEQA